MLSYLDAMRVIRGSKNYEFEDETLTITQAFTGDKVILDLSEMTEEMLDEMGVNDITPKEARWILSDSKTYKFDDTELTIANYRYGDELILDFAHMSEDMYDDLSVEPEDNLEDGFEDAVSALDSEEGLSK